jgi:hypothetical protein
MYRKAKEELDNKRRRYSNFKTTLSVELFYV